METRSIRYRLILILTVALATLSVWGLVAAQEGTPEATPDMAENSPEAETPSQRPFLGVSLEDGESGPVIREVVPGSPADEAGLQIEDVIIRVGDTETAEARAVAEAIRALSVGDSITVEVLRDGETQTLTITLASAPEDVQAPQTPFRDRIFGFSYDPDEQTWAVDQLSEGSPLYEAGLRSGDVIQAFDGKAYSPRELMEYLVTLGAEGSVTLTVERASSTEEIEIQVAALFEMGMMGLVPGGQGFQIPFGMGMGFSNGWLGVHFVTLNEQTAEENDVTQTEGALIQEVVADSPAEEAGLQVGDIITAVNGEPVDAERTLRDRLIAYEPDDTIILDILRGNETLEIEVTLGQPQMGQMMPFFGDGFRRFGPNGRPIFTVHRLYLAHRSKKAICNHLAGTGQQPTPSCLIDVDDKTLGLAVGRFTWRREQWNSAQAHVTISVPSI